MAETTDDAGTVLRVVDISARVDIHEVVLERAIDQDGERARRGGDGLGFADTEGDATIERAQGGLRAPEIHGRQPEDSRGAIRRGLSATAQEAPAGHLVVRRQGQPRGEGLLSGPPAHLGASLGEEPQGVVGANAIDL